jgi:hypothetical protein
MWEMRTPTYIHTPGRLYIHFVLVSHLSFEFLSFYSASILFPSIGEGVQVVVFICNEGLGVT